MYTRSELRIPSSIEILFVRNNQHSEAIVAMCRINCALCCGLFWSGTVNNGNSVFYVLMSVDSKATYRCPENPASSILRITSLSEI
jgi:hypothetical protein